MELIYKTLIVALLLGATNACDNTDLDLQVNPNAITQDRASLDDLYNSIQLTFSAIYVGAEDIPGVASRMYHLTTFSYLALGQPTRFNGLWVNAYANLFPDVDALIAISDAAPSPFDIHVGSAKIMKAYTLMVLVDLFGDVPLTEAGQGAAVISPNSTPGSEVYTATITLLDEAITELTGTGADEPAFDNFYGGDADKWITFANTLKLRAALNMGDVTTFNTLASGDVINSAGDDFQFNWGRNRSNPNSRHPRYNNHYESIDGRYLSNYYMWLLREDKVDGGGATIIDPRIRYYFYRKISDAFFQDGTTYSCHFTALPTDDPGADIAHYDTVDPNLPYCVLADGYSGRDHLNGEGIPPDGPIRTSWGLYPFGGDFDDSSFIDTRDDGTIGGLGEGISPIMLSSFVDFMRAEAVLTMGATGDARALLESGIRASMDKVVGFESLVSEKMETTVTLRDGSEGVIRDLFGTTQADIDSYVAAVLAMYDAAVGNPAQLDIVMKEYYIAAWGNGLEAYNMYRRTGLPLNIQPGLEPAAGSVTDPFPSTFFLPDTHVDRNSNVDQHADLTLRVFWNSAGPSLR